MKNIYKKMGILGLLVSTFASSSFANSAKNFFDFPCCNDLCLSPYIGTDAGYRHVTYGLNGNKLFKTSYPQASVYLGLKFCDYVGIEGGYKFSVLKSHFVSFGAGEIVMGAPVLGAVEHYIAKSQFKGSYGSLLGYLPICPFPIDLIGSIGFSRLQTYHYQALLADTDFEGILAARNFIATGLNFRTIRTLLTLGIGAQYLYCDTVGVRLKLDWENTARIRKVLSFENLPNYVLSLKNSMNYNLGIFIPF